MDFLNETRWNPCDLLLSSGVGFNYAIVVLNTPIKTTLRKEQVLNLWNNALLRVTVDGGTDQWLTWLQNNFKGEKVVDPDLITGDMDSVKPGTLSHFKKLYTKIIYTEDQDETDFTKALLELQKELRERNLDIDHILVFNSVAGRFDQIIANINTLYKMNIQWPEVKIFIVSNSINWLLATGKHKIKIPVSLKKSEEWCALIPFGSKARITTRGLKWNLENSPLEFGHMVSTSNTYNKDDDNEVVVMTDNPIVWSMGVENLLKDLMNNL